MDDGEERPAFLIEPDSEQRDDADFLRIVALGVFEQLLEDAADERDERNYDW